MCSRTGEFINEQTHNNYYYKDKIAKKVWKHLKGQLLIITCCKVCVELRSQLTKTNMQEVYTWNCHCLRNKCHFELSASENPKTIITTAGGSHLRSKMQSTGDTGVIKSEQKRVGTTKLKNKSKVPSYFSIWKQRRTQPQRGHCWVRVCWASKELNFLGIVTERFQ